MKAATKFVSNNGLIQNTYIYHDERILFQTNLGSIMQAYEGCWRGKEILILKKSMEHIGYRDTSARYLQDGGHENKDVLPHFFVRMYHY